MQHRIIVTAALSNWADGDCHATVVIGGTFADGTPAEEVIGVEMPTVDLREDLRDYARRALLALVAEL